MRILVVHNRYLERGGEDETVDAEVALLRSRGHEVDLLVRDNVEVLQRPLWRTALEGIWSPAGWREVYTTLRQKAYDVMHLHNFFPLWSPAVVYAAQAVGIPVVVSLHNYRLLCVNGLLARGERACTLCVGRWVGWPAVVHACYRGNRLATLAGETMRSVHWALGTWQRKVDLFVTFSRFARALFVQSGLPSERLRVRPHFVAPDPGRGGAERRYVLFVGRMVEGKGVRDLMAAWEQVGSPWPLYLVGDGPLAHEVRSWAAGRADVEYVGRLSRQEVYAAMQRAWLVVVPSRYYETFGRVVIEAFATGTPVLVSNQGALAELVEPGLTGERFEAGNVEALVDKIRALLSVPERLYEMGERARQVYEANYTAERGYRGLLAAYHEAQRMHERKRER